MSFDGLDVDVRPAETFESAVKMGRAALEVMGVEQEEIDRVDFEYRLRDCERLELQSFHRRFACRARSIIQPRPRIAQGGRLSSAIEEVCQPARVDRRLKERTSDAAGQDQRDPSCLILLVAGQPAGEPAAPSGQAELCQAGGQAAAGKGSNAA